MKKFRFWGSIVLTIFLTTVTAMATDFASELSLKRDKIEIRQWLENNQIDNAGVYVDKQSHVNVLLKNKNPSITNSINSIAKDPERVRITEVKFSKEELMQAKQKISSALKKLNAGAGVGLATDKNRILVFISKEQYDLLKDKLEETIDGHSIDRSMIEWIFAELTYTQYSEALYPGEDI